MPESYNDDLWQSEFVAPQHTIIDRKIDGANLVTIVELEGSVSEFFRPASDVELAFFGLVTSRPETELTQFYICKYLSYI